MAIPSPIAIIIHKLSIGFKVLHNIKDNKIIEGNPDKIKFVTDSWKFTKNINNKSPNWYLAEIISK